MEDSQRNYLRRSLPAVDRLLREPPLELAGGIFPRSLIVEGVQETLESYRYYIARAPLEDLQVMDLSPSALAAEAAAAVRRNAFPRLRRVLNATGTILHTNLGRAPLAASAAEAIEQVACSYSNLELSLETGQRGSRQDHLEELLCRLAGAEAALVVNNNAAAVLLVLDTLASGREVVLARGELVEIGGAFRIPEVMAKSGACLVEVGTTNRCYLEDYRKALTESTALLMKVHTSNYRIVGFTASVSLAELSELGRERGIPVVEDLGSGVLLDLSPYQREKEPTVREAVASGGDLVTFSGDKLLGGAQAGIIVGRRSLVQLLRENQLARALRVDKFTLAALEATLRLYRDEEQALEKIPVLRMLTLTGDYMEERAFRFAARLKSLLGGRAAVDVERGVSRVGGGALPTEELPTFLVVLSLPGERGAEDLQKNLRLASPPVISRIREGRTLLDLRTIREEEEEELEQAVTRAVESLGETG